MTGDVSIRNTTFLNDIGMIQMNQLLCLSVGLILIRTLVKLSQLVKIMDELSEELNRVYQSAYKPAWDRGEYYGAHYDGIRAVYALGRLDEAMGRFLSEEDRELVGLPTAEIGEDDETN
jgi:hypothetical protein